MLETPEKIRKFWLFLLLFFPVFFAIKIFALGAYSRPLELPEGTLQKIFGSLVDGFLYSTISLPFFYYCAYKKPGTKLLTVSIWLSYLGIGLFIFSIGSLWAVLTVIQSLYNKGAYSFFAFLVFAEILTALLCLAWLITCLKLRKLNFNQQFGEILKSEIYKNLFDSLEGFETKEQLKKFYKETKEKHPEIEKFLTKKYNQKRKEVAAPFA